MAGRLRWFDVSEMGMIRHKPEVAVAWITIGALFLAALATNALASDSAVAGSLLVQILAGFVSVSVLVAAFKWLERASVSWARTTTAALAALVGVNVGLVLWFGPSERVVGMAMPGILLPVAVIMGCLVWLRRRRLGLAIAPRHTEVHDKPGH